MICSAEGCIKGLQADKRRLEQEVTKQKLVSSRYLNHCVELQADAGISPFSYVFPRLL